MQNEEHDLPYELENMPEDLGFGELMPFSDSEVNSLGRYETFLDDSELYLGDGKNIYKVRKRLLGDDELVLTAECVGVCNPDEYDLIMQNESGFDAVVGYVESEFAYYTQEDGFIPSPAETTSQETSLDFSSNAADKSVRRVLED